MELSHYPILAALLDELLDLRAAERAAAARGSVAPGEVLWGGRRYRLVPAQSRAVHALLAARLSGLPGLSALELARAADVPEADVPALVDGCGPLVVRGAAGTFTLGDG